MTTCFVTAFKDLGRGQWKHWSRSTEAYLASFYGLCKMEIDLFAFVEDNLVEAVRKHLSDSESTFQGRHRRITILPMHETFLDETIKSWAYVSVEREIMATPEHKASVAHRSDCPETFIPEYNCINHAKVDFVAEVIRLTQAAYSRYVWIDFGYVRPDGHALPPDGQRHFQLKNTAINAQINVVAMAPLRPFTSRELRTNGYVSVTGGFWFGTPDACLTYRDVYHNTLQRMHAENIADDDQAVMAQIGLNQPHLLNIWPNDLTHPSGWFFGLIHFNSLCQP